MLYLYVFFDDTPRQSDTPPTEADISCVMSGMLQVYRWYGNAYEHLTVNCGKTNWDTVDRAELCDDAMEEIGLYHA